MKKLLLIFAVVLALAACETAKAQTTYANPYYGSTQPGAGGITNYSTGTSLSWWFPTGAATQSVTFPTFTKPVIKYAANTYDSVRQFSTYLFLDTIGSTAGIETVNLTPDEYLTGGALLWVQGHTIVDTTRTVYLYNTATSTPIDTLTYTNSNSNYGFVYDGATWHRFPK